MTTKRQIIELAYDHIGLGKYAYDLTAEDLSNGLMRLNGIVAEWGLSGIETGFPITDNPNAGDIDSDSGLSAGIIRGVSAALAVDIAPGFGKQVSPDVQRSAQQGRRMAIATSIEIPTREIDNLSVPAGAGYKDRDSFILPSENQNEVKQ